MNRDAGAGAVLSFVVVALVAVAFHRPETPLAAVRPARPIEAVAPPRDAPPPPLPRPTPGVPLPELSPAPELPPRPPRPAPVPSQAPRPIRPASRRRAVRRPESAFALVEQGESLADVARRVYGSESEAESLWLANRDQLDGPSAPVHAGMLLRTP